MKPLQLTLDLVVEHFRPGWTITHTTYVIKREMREYLAVWQIAVDIYQRGGAPYGDSLHGMLRFLHERRG